jgi:hypothetical protein
MPARPRPPDSFLERYRRFEALSLRQRMCLPIGGAIRRVDGDPEVPIRPPGSWHNLRASFRLPSLQALRQDPRHAPGRFGIGIGGCRSRRLVDATAAMRRCASSARAALLGFFYRGRYEIFRSALARPFPGGALVFSAMTVPRQTGILDDHTIADFEADVLALLAGTRLKPIPVAPILSAQARAIGAHSTQVLLSSYTALKIWLKHTPTSFTPTFNAPVLFNLVPRIIFDGECRKIAPRRLIFLWSSSKDTTAPYKAVVKATQDGQLVFLESVYRIQFAQVRRAVATSSPVQSRMRNPL